MSTIQALLAQASSQLTAAGVPEAAGDARRLMAAALGVAPAQVTPRAGEAAPEAAAAVFAAHLAERLARRPVAQILGRRAFWGREFEVTRDVLDPRPETETLVALALEETPPRRILDLGTGSGAILVSLLCEWPGALGVGTDASGGAVEVAARNAARHGVERRASLLEADWFPGGPGRFDLVVSNPPYIPAGEMAGLAPEVRDWEPRGALTPGPRGLESYERIAAGLETALAPGGRALFEIGAGQEADVAMIFQVAGFDGLTLHPDLDGRPRALRVARQ